MPNVRASSGMIGTTRLPNPGSRMRLRRSLANTIVVLTAVEEPRELRVGLRDGGRQRPAPDDALRQLTAERPTPLQEIAHLLGIGARVVVRRLRELLVGDRELQPVAEDAQLGLGQLLGLVGDVATLDAGAERPALDRLGQDHGGRALELGGQLVGGVELPVVVAARRRRSGRRPRGARPGGRDEGRGRRSARGYRPRRRPSTSGTRRRPSRSSC